MSLIASTKQKDAIFRELIEFIPTKLTCEDCLDIARGRVAALYWEVNNKDISVGGLLRKTVYR